MNFKKLKNVKLLISLLSLIFIFFTFLPIYTYIGTYFIKEVCINEKCYLLPSHWIILTKVEDHIVSYFGLDITGHIHESLDNIVLLRSDSAGATIRISDYDFEEDINTLKQIGYVLKKDNECIYYMVDTNEFSSILLVKENLSVSIYGDVNNAKTLMLNMLCNPTKLYSTFK